jgi:cell division protein FtsB
MSIIDEFDFIEKKDINYKLIILVVFVILFAVYVGNLLFGNKSVSRLVELQNQREILEKEVKKIENDNSKKQKKYFELKQLEGN